MSALNKVKDTPFITNFQFNKDLNHQKGSEHLSVKIYLNHSHQHQDRITEYRVIKVG